MSYEKKQVLYDLRVAYDGPFLIEDLFEEVNNWVEKEGYTLEQKKKLEHLDKSGKEIEWLVEIHHELNPEFQSVVRLRVLIRNLKEITLERKGKKVRVNSGSAFVGIDGFLHSIYTSYWGRKPFYYFFRTIIDQYIYNFWQDKEDGYVVADCHDIYKTLRAFFHLQKYKYE